MKRIGVFLFLFAVLGFFSQGAVAWSAQSDSTTEDAAIQNARQQYREYLKQLKVLNQQFNKVTGDMAKIIKEEGVPTWETGNLDLGLGSGEADIKDLGNTLEVRMELPGLDKNSLLVTLSDDKMLRIRGKKKFDDKNPDVDRSVELPAVVEKQGMGASYEDGVLIVTLKKDLSRLEETRIPVQ